MTRLFLLAATLGLSGCLFNDCSFDVETNESTASIGADASAVGDTLTLAFVDTYEPSIRATVPAGLGPNVNPSGDGRVRLYLETEALQFSDAPPYQLAASTVGDTVYVYVEGRFDPSVLTRQACSPPETSIRIDVQSVSAPPGVRVIRTTRVDAYDLRFAAAQALRQRDAHRPTSV